MYKELWNKNVVALTMIEVITLIGAIVSFILAIIRIYEFFRDQALLKINPGVLYWFIEEGEHPVLKLHIEIEVTNRGRLPTTISSALVEYLTFPNKNGWLVTHLNNDGFVFTEVRIEQNDRKKIFLSNQVPIYGNIIEQSKDMAEMREGKLRIYASHKDYEFPVSMINAR
jgi:hypothetical protein